MMAKMTPQFTSDSPLAQDRSSREAKISAARENKPFPASARARRDRPKADFLGLYRPLSGKKRPYWGMPRWLSETQNPGIYGKS
jgi:hypothetical protein